jgi:hypothetical protein
MLRPTTVKRYAYVNTSSKAGYPVEVEFKVADVDRIAKWVNHYGNPSYAIRLKDRTVLYLVDDFGGTNDLGHIRVEHCKSKREMFARAGLPGA